MDTTMVREAGVTPDQHRGGGRRGDPQSRGLARPRRPQRPLFQWIAQASPDPQAHNERDRERLRTFSLELCGLAAMPGNAA